MFTLNNLFCKAVVTALFFASVDTFAQTPDYFLQTSDGALAVELSRGDKVINIAMMFFKASELDYVVVERSLDSQLQFNQCGYVKFNDSAKDTVVMVKKDLYPFSTVGAVFYRVKAVSKEGATRIYPSVRLPALGVSKEH